MDSILRLRRAERIPQVAADVGPVRRQLESQMGSTLSRSRAARILNVSQTALDRWVDIGQIPVVVTPRGRHEVPRKVVIELRESIDSVESKGVTRHPLGAAIAERRIAAEAGGPVHGDEDLDRLPLAHETAARRGLAYYREIAGRLDERMIADAKDRLDRLSAERHIHPRYADRWREILSLPVSDLGAAITAETQDAHDLRQNSPFAGVLNELERRRIIDTVR